MLSRIHSLATLEFDRWMGELERKPELKPLTEFWEYTSVLLDIRSSLFAASVFSHFEDSASSSALSDPHAIRMLSAAFRRFRTVAYKAPVGPNLKLELQSRYKAARALCEILEGPWREDHRKDDP